MARRFCELETVFGGAKSSKLPARSVSDGQKGSASYNFTLPAMSSLTLLEAFEALGTPAKRPLAYSRLLELLTSEPEDLLATLKSLLEDPTQVPRALQGLSALLELDTARTLGILQEDQLQSRIVTLAKSLLYNSASSTDSGPEQSSALRSESQLCLAQLLSTAASQQQARPLLQSLDAEPWLESASRSPTASPLQITSDTALAKLLLSNTSQKPENYTRLQAVARRVVASLSAVNSSSEVFATALEGLAILTLLPQARAQLFQSSIVSMLCTPTAFKPTGPSATPKEVQKQFSIACIYANVSSYKPTPTDASQERLRQLAAQAQSTEAEATAWETDQVIEQRSRALIKDGVMDVCGLLVRSVSLNTRRKTGVALANLTRCDKATRGTLLQQGAATMFLNLARQEPSNQPTSTETPNPDHLLSIQGLARLLITANPALALTPDLQLEAIRLLSTAISASEASLLAVFEALMALTNLCSLSEQSRSHFVGCLPANMSTLDSIMLYDDKASNGHMMCRRAATQLVCNLTMCEAGFAHFAGDANLTLEDGVAPALPPSRCQSRLHLLLALCDVEDMDTRMAASAALAMLTVSPKVCCLLLEKEEVKDRSLEIMGGLVEDPTSAGLRQRGLACMGNLIQRLVLFSRETQERVASSRCKSALEGLKGQEGADAAPLLVHLDKYARRD